MGSAFYDNTETWETDLVKIVADFGIQSIYVVGIATDFCVYWTARDAKRLDYNTYVVQDATANIFEKATIDALADMKQKGIQIIQTADVLNTMCQSAVSGAVAHLSMVSVWTALFFCVIASLGV